MAQYFEMERDSIDMAWIWNVNGTVSPRAYSRRPDVMLVQHALNTVMAPLELTDSKGKRITSYLVRDGYMGHHTNEAIMAYQKSLKARGFYVKADGVVDPASRSGWTRDGNAQFTIVYLNRDHRRFNGGKMMEEKDFPSLLQAELLVNKSLR